jgi:hypothetical protein
MEKRVTPKGNEEEEKYSEPKIKKKKGNKNERYVKVK